MNYETEMATIRTDAASLALAARRLGWSMARTVPAAVQHAAASRVDMLKRDNEAIRRLPRQEQLRIWSDIETEERVARLLACGVARARVEPVIAPLAVRVRTYVQTRRGDVLLSIPDGLDRVTADGVIMLRLLETALRPTIETASVAVLAAMYRAALDRQDAPAVVELRLVEERMARGGTATVEGDLSIVKELGVLIADVQDLRIEPTAELAEAEATIQHARKAVSLAEVARVAPVDAARDDAARAAFEAEAGAYQMALDAEAAQ